MDNAETCTFFTSVRRVFEATDEHGTTYSWEDGVIIHDCGKDAGHRESHKCSCGARFLNRGKHDGA